MRGATLANSAPVKFRTTMSQFAATLRQLPPN